VWYVATALMVELLGGPAIGVLMYLARSGVLSSHLAVLVQAHGSLQLLGWGGLFVAGMAQRLADRMAERGAGVMPVVSHEAPERLVGVVSQFELLRARERLLQEERHRERVLRVRTVPRGQAASGG
jgi:hypothetical protein